MFILALNNWSVSRFVARKTICVRVRVQVRVRVGEHFLGNFGQICGTKITFAILKEKNFKILNLLTNQLASWLAGRLATGEVPGSNPGKGVNINYKLSRGEICEG